MPKQITRAVKVEAILSAMDDWDLDTLLSWAKDQRRELLDKCSDAEVQDCWESDCNEDEHEDEPGLACPDCGGTNTESNDPRPGTDDCERYCRDCSAGYDVPKTTTEES